MPNKVDPIRSRARAQVRRDGFGRATSNGVDNPNPPERARIKSGTAVWIIEKANYGTNKYKQGFVKDILTSRGSHPRGIKVRLTDGSVGRVQWLMEGE